MMWRAFAAWIILLVLAVLNGAVRIAWIIPQVGETLGYMLSVLSLSIFILAATWFLIGWIAPATAGEAIAVGTFWLVLTLLFEFGAGHYLFKNPWEKLFLEYNILEGRIWILVLLTTMFAPLLMSHLRGLLLKVQ